MKNLKYLHNGQWQYSSHRTLNTWKYILFLGPTSWDLLVTTVTIETTEYELFISVFLGKEWVSLWDHCSFNTFWPALSSLPSLRCLLDPEWSLCTCTLHLVLGRNVEESLNGSLTGKVNVVSLVLHALDACTMRVNLQKFSDCLYNLWPWAKILSVLPVRLGSTGEMEGT